MENISLGLLLMIVGMVSVFVILVIVIYGGELLIRIVNRFAPQPQAVREAPEADPSVREILEKAVAGITSGRGRIVKITKLG